MFTAGDNVYEDGTAEEYADCYGPSWGRHKDRTYPAIGNHEYHTLNGAPHFEYFGAAAGDPDKGYYSYEAGAWKVIVLNSNAGRVPVEAGSEQELWLRAELAASDQACTLAYWHHPRFSSGVYGDDIRFDAFWQALYEYGAELVVVGHEHHYERFAPLDPAGEIDTTNGIRQIIARNRRTLPPPYPAAAGRKRGAGLEHARRAAADPAPRLVRLGVRFDRRQHLHRRGVGGVPLRVLVYDGPGWTRRQFFPEADIPRAKRADHRRESAAGRAEEGMKQWARLDSPSRQRRDIP